ncbi:MAG: glycosyltransferase family 4 protein [Bacillota bacterium]
MKVLMLSWEYPPQSVGGLARHVKDLAGALAASGNEVHVVTRGAEEASYYEVVDGVHVHRVYQLSLQAPDFLHWVNQLNFSLVEKGIQVLNHGNFDILHAHDWLAAYAARVLKHAYKIPLVSTIHATEAGRNQGLHSPMQNFIHSIEWFLTYESWKVIVCSNHMIGEVKGLFGLPADKVVKIPNGVYAAKFFDGKRVNFGSELYQLVEPHEKMIFFVGRLVREKGVHVLIDSIPMVLQETPNVKVIIAGSGPMEGQLHHQINRMGLGAKVRLTGYIEDNLLKQLYKRADVAVFPSLYEPFGIVALEGMASGTAVVVSDTGGLGEIIRHGDNGLKFYPGNPHSLADQIKAVLRNQKFAEDLAERGRKSVLKEYDWSSISDKTLDVYKLVKKEYEKSDWLYERSLPSKAHVSKEEMAKYSLLGQRMLN